MVNKGCGKIALEGQGEKEPALLAHIWTALNTLPRYGFSFPTPNQNLRL